MTFRFTALLLALVISHGAIADATCPPAEGIAVQVLGSGGPIADDARASSAYLVWVDGRSRALIDVGGGAFLRFGEAQARFEDLDFIGLSHFHTDHSADFPALLKSGVFSGRERTLVVAGPSGNDRFPGLDEYLASLLKAGTGAYHYLSGYLDGSDNLPRLEPAEIDADFDDDRDLLGGQDAEIIVRARHVPHGIVPALGFRIEARGVSVVFASDQNGGDDDFAKYADGASLLVMHMTVGEGASGRALQLHAKPGRIGQVAAAANADRLLLSHFMARSLDNFEKNVAAAEDAFAGKVIVAGDLLCIAL